VNFAETTEHALGTWSFEPGEEIADGLHAWQRLGSGRRCETWLAWSAPLWSHITVKLLRPDATDVRDRRALAREADMCRALAHPGVQRLLDAQPDGARPYLVFEYIEGPSLEEVLEEAGTLDGPDVIRLGMQLASVLAYIHLKGFVHLDLKPTNVVLRDGRAVLLDLDIARTIGARGSGRKPRGSPPFMAPEQIRCAPAAPSMDLFALGVVLYEAATGALAFAPEGSGESRLYPQLAHVPVAARLLAPELPRAVEAVIMRLLDRDPARRPATAAVTLACLAAVLPDDEEGLWPPWADQLLPRLGPVDAGLR
jgi:serine/threonine protein kinase